MKPEITVETELEAGIHNADYFYELAVRLYNANDLENARQVAYHLHIIEPFDARSYKTLGVVNQAMEYYSWAVGAYKRAILLNVNDTDVMFYLAQCYVHLTNYDEAFKWLESCLIMKPDHPEAIKLLPHVRKKMT